MRYLRWILPLLVGVLVVCLAVFFLLKAFGITLTGFTVTTADPFRVATLDGVIWLLPHEKGHYSEGSEFVYQGTSVSATKRGGVLIINGKPYGTLTTGDSVDLSTQGVVLVNGHPRQPQ